MSDKLRERLSQAASAMEQWLNSQVLGTGREEYQELRAHVRELRAIAESGAAPAVGQFSDNDINIWISGLPALTSNGRTFRYVTVSDVNALLRSVAAKETR